MILLDEIGPATLENVSRLRRTARRCLQSLHIDEQLVNDMQLAIAELATNAVVHAKTPPTTLRLVLSLRGAAIRLELEDDGHPFEIFAEAWRAASAKPLAATSTSGLGLALAHATLRDVAYQAGPPNRLVGWRPLKRTKPAVLVVEDTPSLLMLYSAILAPHYRVHPATSLAEARQAIAFSQIDVIVSDYHLGEDCATQLFSDLEQDPERLPTPLILISADETPPVRTSAERYGIEQFLHKPVTPTALLAAVDRGLSASKRRLAALLRYVGANAEKLLQAPPVSEMAALGISLQMGSALVGGGDFVLHLKSANFDRLVVGDFMGHGLRANAGAIAFAAMMRTVHAVSALSAGEYLSAMSEAMRADAALSSLLATTLVIDQNADRSLSIASAAHPAPVRVAATTSMAVDVSGPLLGLVPAPRYETASIVLGNAERLVVATDGVEPALLAGGGCLPATLIARLQAAANEPIEKAGAAVGSWAADTLGPSPRDDWTIMLIE